MSKPATLPTTSAGVLLPQCYEAARAAIADCEQIDECKNWSDKAAALASYARQAKDDSLRVMAVRIQARAERRMGELLKSIEAGHGARDGKRGAAAVPPLTRTQVASDAGLSERQRKTAIRVASIPVADFDRQVEGPAPPTVTALPRQGTQRIDRPSAVVSSPWVAIECPDTRRACETLEGFARLCAAHDPAGIAKSLSASEAAALTQMVEMVDQWLDRVMMALSSEF